MHSFLVTIEGASRAPIEAQLVQAHFGASLFTTLEEIYNLNITGRLSTAMLIIRLPVDEQWEKEELENLSSERVRRLFARPDAAASAFERARDRSVHILSSFNGRPFITKNLNPFWRDDLLVTYDIKIEEALATIRKTEIEHILEHSRAILTCPSGSSYLTPSKRLVRSFIRVGNIQYERDAIDAIFFWLLPFMDDVGAILTDTWSISSIGFSVARNMQTYFGGERRFVEMLPSYDDGSDDEARQRTRAVIGRLGTECVASNSNSKYVLCLISATQTGSLARRVAEVFKLSGIALEPRFVALFGLGVGSEPPEIHCLHDLSTDPRFALLADESHPQSEPIKIDPQVYFPLKFTDSVVELNKSLADLSRPFFDRYVGANLIEVHRDYYEDGGRRHHHAIHLATEKLLSVPSFRSQLEQKLRLLPSAPLFIVHPPNEAGRLLATYALRFLMSQGHYCPVYTHPNLFFSTPLTAADETLRHFIKNAREDQSILVLDDFCITGTRLSQYQRYIRTERFAGRVDYLVGIARPSHPNVWDKLKRNLAYREKQLARHTIDCVDSILLPDWRDKDCPWCIEKQLYERWIKSEELPKLLMQRLERLSRSASLTQELFLEIPGLPPVQLGPNSLFAPENANQAEVFAAISAALQYLRTRTSIDRPELGPRRFPISTVLNHSDYLRSTWTDSILRATFLRAAASDELTYAEAERENDRIKDLRNLLLQPADGEHDIALEILLAANLEKCRVEANSELLVALQEYGASEVFEYFCKQLLALEPKA